MRSTLIRATTDVWGLYVLYDPPKDELSVEGLCGGFAMYSVRIVLRPAERDALKRGTLDLSQLNRDMCDSDDFQARRVKPRGESTRVPLAQLLSMLP